MPSLLSIQSLKRYLQGKLRSKRKPGSAKENALLHTSSPDTGGISTTKSPLRLYALTIGIDEYSSLKALKGAVSDADDVSNFLMADLGVPSDHIVNLRNEHATRKRIIDEFQNLWSNPHINRGDPILIYYAGHGGLAEANQEWKERYGAKKIQTNCIPDKTIAQLLNKLAAEKGDNIIVIFDSCHSASGNRDEASLKPTKRDRMYEARKSAPDPADIDDELRYGVEKLEHHKPLIREEVEVVLFAAAKWRWYLQHTNLDQDENLEMSMVKVATREGDRARRKYLKEPEHVHAEASVVELVVDPTSLHGLKLHNNINLPLYVRMFYFDPADFSIGDMFGQNVANGEGAPNLAPGGQLVIGDGADGGAPVKFNISSSGQVEVGYMKVFWSTEPLELDHVKQKSAFELKPVNRKNNSPAYSYPVDSEQTTFGRNDDCDIRLLYGWVSGLHCKLFFQNAKAFLSVYGLNGVIVDGSHIGRNPDADGESSETTIPIMNNSQIEIYRKRFIFEYPSKELRIKAMAEPMTVKPKRTLRLSMIQSAQVFTPSKPTADASTPKSHRRRRSETLAEQLQSPIKPFSPARPAPSANMGHETLSVADEEREVTLVGPGGAQSVVVLEEEKDLVVVEAIGEESDEEDLSDDEEIIRDKENANPFDLGRSPASQHDKASSSASPAPAVQRSLSANTPSSSYAPKRPNLQRSAASAPAPSSSPASNNTSQPARTPARKARFSLHKAVLLRSAQRQLVERERLNQFQAREAPIFDEDADIDMDDIEPEFAEEPESDLNLMVGDANVDVRLASDVDHLTVQDPDADEEDAVESVVSPLRSGAHPANGSFSDDSEHSFNQAADQSEGDISVESDISEINQGQEQESTPIGSRIRESLSVLGNLLPNLLKTPSDSASTEDSEEVDIVDQRRNAPRVKVEPSEEEPPLHFSDSEDEDEDEGEDQGQVSPSDRIQTPVDDDSNPVHNGEPAGATIKLEETPTQPRRLNAFMTPQVSRPNFARAPVGRKSVALGAESGEVNDLNWLPSRVPVVKAEADSEEEEDHDMLEDPIVEDEPVLSDLKHIPELDAEEKAARRQSALAVLAAGPRQLPTRRQSVAPHLAISEPLDPNDRRTTLAGDALGAPVGTPQHASTLAKASDYQVAIDIDYMRRQSMSRASREEKPIGPLFGEAVTGDIKLEDSEELVAALEPDDIKQELEEAEHELEELEDEAETEAELSVDEEGEEVTDSEDGSDHDGFDDEQNDVQEQSDTETEQKAFDEHVEEETIPEGTKVPAVLPAAGPSTPALKGIRSLFRAEEVKGLGTQTPAGLDGMVQLFGPEAELEAELPAQDKPSRLRTNYDIQGSRGGPDAFRRHPCKDGCDGSQGCLTVSRIASRTLREPSKLPSRIKTPTEEPEAPAPKAATRKAVPAATVSVVLPRRAKAPKTEADAEAKDEPESTASRLKAPTKRVTRTASGASHTTDDTKPLTRTASSMSIDDKPATRRGRAAAAAPAIEEEAKPATRTTRAKAAAPTRRKDATSSARPTTPTTEAGDDKDPMDTIPLPESPTKRSTRAKVTTVKVEPDDDESIPATRSRTRTTESDTSKDKRTTTKRVASKDVDENKENAAVDVPEAETETKVKASGLPTKTTRKVSATVSKLPAPTKTASKTEPATTSATTRALRTRARK
ncbi:ICE-like protease (caspase) p20 domain protein [Rhizoctonia solani]|uniref:ICE-like protease (Caspase) p20 domain protein n=1 Tax=Rhizoctonia solani TaxID=456999 RepID=A0A8H8T127_9AGAM|nr:ICE-like protease (caspase) p20 domain protein [Rhizoctonia solani]QRW26006.1 ICE-like protease (caspase) p20 domain protein [Rhizoctonia solani]